MKKALYVVCFSIMFMFLGNVKADSVCKYKIPKGVINSKETSLELYNDEGGLELNKYYSKNQISPGKNVKLKLTKDGDGKLSCPSIILDITTTKKVTFYSSVKQCKENQTFGKDSCKKEIYEGTFSSSDDLTGGSTSGKTNAKLITETTNSCKYRSHRFEITVKSDKSTSCRVGTSAANPPECKSKITDEIFKNFNKNQFICPKYLYYSSYSGGTGNLKHYTVEIISTGGSNEPDNSLSDQFRDPDNYNNGSATDEWINGHPGDEYKENIDPCDVIDKEGSLYKILKQIINYTQIGTIFIVILLSGLDFIGAISSGDDDAVKKALGKTKNRIIALVLVFLVPAIVNLLLTIVNVGACGSNSDFVSELFK